jgi:hypothetical protein
MSDITRYQLRGPGLEVTYQKGELFIDGDRSYLEDRHFTEGLSEAPIAAVGQTVTAVVNESTRSGSEILLTLLLPDANPRDADGEEITGVAVITDSGGMGGSVQQEYETRELSGRVSLISA